MLKFLFIAILAAFSLTGFAQITIIGPSCAAPGVAYQYLLSGAMDSSTNLQVCVKGGTIGDSTSTCQSGKKLSYVIIVWNGKTGNASISIKSAAGAGNLNVSVINLLQGGKIDNSQNSESIGYDSLPSAINCSIASGGGCTTRYTYQWQGSIDNVSWLDILGAIRQNLNLTSTLKQTSYFRRRVSELNSGAIAYSDVGLVDVKAPPPSANNIHTP